MKALLKPIMWVCLFFFFVSKYRMRRLIESNELQLSDVWRNDWILVKEYAVFIRKYNPDVMLQEIDYNTRNRWNFKVSTQLAAGAFFCIWESYGNRRWRIWSSYMFKVPLCLSIINLLKG